MSGHWWSLTPEIWIDIAEYLLLQEFILLKIATTHTHLSNHLKGFVRRVNLTLDFGQPHATRYTPLPPISPHSSERTASLQVVLFGACPKLAPGHINYMHANFTTILTRLHLDCAAVYLPFIKMEYIKFAKNHQHYLMDVFDGLEKKDDGTWQNPWIDLVELTPNLTHLYLNDPMQIFVNFCAHQLNFIELFFTKLAPLSLTYLATNLISQLWHGLVDSLPPTLEVWKLLRAPDVFPVVNDYQTTAQLDVSMAAKLPKSLHHLELGQNSITDPHIHLDKVSACFCSFMHGKEVPPSLTRLVVSGKMSILNGLVLPDTLTWLSIANSYADISILESLPRTMILFHCGELRGASNLASVKSAFLKLPPKITSLSIQKLDYKSLSKSPLTIYDLFVSSIIVRLRHLCLSLPLHLSRSDLDESLAQIETIDIHEAGSIAECATAALCARISLVKCRYIVSDGYYASQITSPDATNPNHHFDRLCIVLAADNWSTNTTPDVAKRITIGQDRNTINGRVVISNRVDFLPRWPWTMENTFDVSFILPKRLPRLLNSLPGSYSCNYSELDDMPPYLTSVEKTFNINFTDVELVVALRRFEQRNNVSLFNDIGKTYAHPDTLSLIMAQKCPEISSIAAKSKTHTFPLTNKVLAHFPDSIIDLTFTLGSWFNDATFDYFSMLTRLTIRGAGPELENCYRMLYKLAALSSLSICPSFLLPNTGFKYIPTSVTVLVIAHNSNMANAIPASHLAFIAETVQFLEIAHPCLPTNQDLALLPLNGKLNQLVLPFAKNLTGECIHYLPKSVTKIAFPTLSTCKQVNKLLSDRS